MNFENCEDKSFISVDGDKINFSTSSDGASLRLMPSIAHEMPASQNICSSQKIGNYFSSVLIKCEEPEMSDSDNYNTEMDSKPQILNTVNTNDQSGLVVNIKPEPFEFESRVKQEFVSIQGINPIDAAIKYEKTEMSCSENTMIFSEEAKNTNEQFDFKCDPLATETYVKQENEVYVVPLFSTFSNGNSDTDHNNGDDRSVLVNEKQSELNCKNKTFQCDVCNRTFNCRSNLKKHIRTHTGEKPYQCDVCNNCFAQRDSLKVHKRAHSGVKPYHCDICDKTFNHSSVLTKHKKTHTGEKPYQCDICNNCFTRRDSLNFHKRVHSGVKPYHCDICDKNFSRSGDLSKHKLTHTGEKPYKCDICDKCFTQHVSLTVHKRLHSGEKPYQCDVCSKTFNHPSHLRGHKRTHTGEEPYRCDVCNKRFSKLRSLSTHKLTHTE